MSQSPVIKVHFTQAFNESFYDCQGSPELIAAFEKKISEAGLLP